MLKSLWKKITASALSIGLLSGCGGGTGLVSTGSSAPASSSAAGPIKAAVRTTSSIKSLYDTIYPGDTYEVGWGYVLPCTRGSYGLVSPATFAGSISPDTLSASFGDTTTYYTYISIEIPPGTPPGQYSYEIDANYSGLSTYVRNAKTGGAAKCGTIGTSKNTEYFIVSAPPDTYLVGQISAFLSQAQAVGVQSAHVLGSAVNALIKGTYKAFVSSANVSKVIWNSSLNATGTSVQQLMADPNAFVRFSSNAAGAIKGQFWTQMNQIIDAEGNIITNPNVIKSQLGLTYSPSYVALSQGFQNGTTVYVGSIASAAEGGPPGSWGGVIQFYAAESETAIATGAPIAIAQFEQIAASIPPLSIERRPFELPAPAAK